MLQGKKVSAVIVAGGASRRMGFDKLQAPLNGRTVLEQSVQAFVRHPLIDEIIVVTSAASRERVVSQLGTLPKVTAVVCGGAERSDSVRCGVASATGEWLAIHDAARPFVSEQVITDALQAAQECGCAAPAVPVKDTVKIAAQDCTVRSTPDRSTLYAVQTPQIVQKEKYLLALQRLDGRAVTDECMVMELVGFPVRLSAGEYANRKITTPEDLPMEQRPEFRIGHGYDVHRLTEGRRLILGGVDIPFEKGLLGHSDADVLTHAVMDALLGAVAQGDIGQHFPDTDPQYAGADSLQLLEKVRDILAGNGWRVGNLDATLLCQRPKLAPYIPLMRENLASALQIPPELVSVKATTEEKLGFTGEGLGIAAHCVALIRRADQ